MGECSTWIRFLRVLGTVASGKTNMVLSGTFLAAAMVIGSWSVLLLGAFTCAGYISWQLRSPAVWQEALLSVRLAQWQLPGAHEVPEVLAGTVLKVRAVCAEALRTFQATPADLRQRLAFVPPVLRELEACAGMLVRRLAGTTNYLHGARREALEEEIRLLTEAMQQDMDMDVDRLREQGLTLRLRERQLQLLRDIQLAAARAEARLARVVAAIECIPARVIRLRVLHEEHREASCNDLEGILAGVDRDLAGLEEVLSVPSMAGELLT